MTVQIPALATPVPQSTDPVNFAARADAFLASLEPFAAAANLQNVENNQLNVSTVQAAGVAQSASAAAMAALGAPRFDPTVSYLAGNQVWSPVDAKIYRRLVAGRSAVDPSADPANWKVHIQTKADLGLGNVDNTSDANKPVSLLQKAALDAKETPAGALAQMRSFGLGVTVLAPTLANVDAADTASGFHRVVPATTGVKPIGSPPNGVVEIIRFNDKDCRQIYYGIGTSADGKGVWVRHIAWDGTESLPTPWLRLAATESPVFTGAPSTPSMKFGNVTSADLTTLDFYEEGTFTPSLVGESGSITLSIAAGAYTRIGNRVLWSARLQVSALAGVTGSLQINGLPFMVIANSRAAGGVSIGLVSGLAAGINAFTSMHPAGTSTVRFYTRAASETNSRSVSVADITAAFQVYLQGQYEV